MIGYLDIFARCSAFRELGINFVRRFDTRHVVPTIRTRRTFDCSRPFHLCNIDPAISTGTSSTSDRIGKFCDVIAIAGPTGFVITILLLLYSDLNTSNRRR